ncbi:MAG: serine acetyltransferase [Bdellovibrionales bacterium]|nr:serine acetyltransferase [Bdellovibrionales bacterium]
MDTSRDNARTGAIERTVRGLLPLYAEDEQDSPRRVLRGYPRPQRIVEAQRFLLATLFPGAIPELEDKPLQELLSDSLHRAWELLEAEVERALPFRWKGAAATRGGQEPCEKVEASALDLVTCFFETLPAIRELLVEDVQAAYDGDPAALTYAEIKLAYPGILAIASHRLAHELYRLNVPILPRVMSEWTHSRTGVDIHPGADIGRGFFIDHATGVVIGETARIGNRVKLYQGVTLGARSFELDADGYPVKHVRRHPTVEDNVVIYSHATILGGDTVVGKGSTIGGNVFLMESVPAGSMVVRGDSGSPKVKTRNKL